MAGRQPSVSQGRRRLSRLAAERCSGLDSSPHHQRVGMSAVAKIERKGAAKVHAGELLGRGGNVETQWKAANEFSSKVRGKLRFDSVEQGWFTWAGSHWERDRMNVALSEACDFTEIKSARFEFNGDFAAAREFGRLPTAKAILA